MAAGDHYRIKAAQMNERARNERELFLRAEMENLALAYLRLADQADRNAGNDLVYETPPQPDPDEDDIGPSKGLQAS